MDFDEDHWASAISQPDWYLEFNKFKSQAEKTLRLGSDEMALLNKKVRHFFEEALKHNQVAVAEKGPDLDIQRQPVDTIVIHHTSAKAGYRLEYMEATQLLNIYAPYFTKPTLGGETNLKGKPIWSGHFRNGRPSFICYHWLMRMDGQFERLLDDNQIGWHAGNWPINCRSIAICLDNDFEHMCPTDELLSELASHIKQNYPQVKASKIIGHCEARPGTTCPGTHFMSEWKSKLVELVKG